MGENIPDLNSGWMDLGQEHRLCSPGLNPCLHVLRVSREAVQPLRASVSFPVKWGEQHLPDRLAVRGLNELLTLPGTWCALGKWQLLLFLSEKKEGLVCGDIKSFRPLLRILDRERRLEGESLLRQEPLRSSVDRSV